MFSWLMTKFYDRIMADAEEKGLQSWRAELLQQVSGDVLELGPGTGVNLPLYPNTVKKLLLAEPNLHMQKILQAKLVNYHQLNAQHIQYDGETINLPQNSLDNIVSTLVLCTVPKPEKVLSEVYRVLKPKGKLVFIEHVMAKENPERLKWQRRLEPIWKVVACGCRVTRDTEKLICSAGFKIESLTTQSMRGVPPIIRPSIRGWAVKQ